MKKQASHRHINGHIVDTIDLINLSYEPDIAIHTGQSAEDVTLLRFFSRKKKGFYVDIGAFDPYKYSNTFLLHKLYEWRGINIDPSPLTIKKFEKSRPNDININYAVDKKAGKKKYFRFSKEARNTLSPENVERQNERRDVSITGEDTVETLPLGQLLQDNLPEKTHIDVMNIDVEGLEMNVLDSNDWKLFRPTVIVIEDYDIQQGNLLSSPIYKYLSDKNYRFFSHHFDTSFYLDTLNTKGHDDLVKQSRKGLTQNIQNPDHSRDILELLKERNPSILLPHEVDVLKRDLSRANQKIKNIQESKSWKITKPLRSISSTIKRIAKY